MLHLSYLLYRNYCRLSLFWKLHQEIIHWDRPRGSCLKCSARLEISLGENCRAVTKQDPGAQKQKHDNDCAENIVKAPVRFIEKTNQTLFRLICCERKTLFRLEKEVEMYILLNY